MEQYARWSEVRDEGELHPTMRMRRGLNILLAEDDAEMRHFLYAELRADGHVVSMTCDGTEMIEALSGMSKVPFAASDVIIMDVRMPGYSGLHILAALRAAEWSTPVILITAFGDQRVHEEGARLGAAVVFDKPFDIEDLRTALLNLGPTDSGIAGGEHGGALRNRDDEPG
jgi:DNA-binding response OmpR family regulator